MYHTEGNKEKRRNNTQRSEKTQKIEETEKKQTKDNIKWAVNEEEIEKPEQTKEKEN